MKRLVVYILALFVLVTPCAFSVTKTVSGSITSVEYGDGSVGTTVKINLGSNSGLKEGSMGWVSKGDETIAYLKILSVTGGTAVAIVTAHENVNKVTSGLPVRFNIIEVLYLVQVTVTKDENDAESLCTILKVYGYPAYTKELSDETYRVGIKWFRTREEAEAVIREIKAKGICDTCEPEVGTGWP